MPLELTDAEVDRWAALIVPTASCSIWTGAVGRDGYGKFALQRASRQRTVTPHQVAVVAGGVEIPAGATLMHDCDVRVCVRVGPGRVVVATPRANLRQAADCGRLRGLHPGVVDERGRAGASRAGGPVRRGRFRQQ